MWRHRDLSFGDTPNYYGSAWQWHMTHTLDLSRAPLYAMFYGSLLRFSHDAFTVTTAHRIIIVLTSAALVWALARRLLPPLPAWLVAAWWVILPANYEALSEVHQF